MEISFHDILNEMVQDAAFCNRARASRGMMQAWLGITRARLTHMGEVLCEWRICPTLYGEQPQAFWDQALENEIRFLREEEARKCGKIS